MPDSPLLSDIEQLDDVSETHKVVKFESTFSEQLTKIMRDRTVLRWDSPLMDGVTMGTSIEDVSRVLIHPKMIDEMSDRMNGLSMRWTSPLSVLVPSFPEQLHETMQDLPIHMRADTERNIVDCYSRFCDWLVHLPLPGIRDVLVWREKYQRAPAEYAIRNMKAVDFFACIYNLRLLVAKAGIDAANNFVSTYGDRVEALKKPHIHHLLKDTLETLVDGYLRFRYANVFFMAEARNLVCAYLTCSERVAYTGLVPSRRLFGKGKKKKNEAKLAQASMSVGVRWKHNDHMPKYEGLSEHARESYRYVHSATAALRNTCLYSDALPWVTENKLLTGVQAASSALAVCLLWRWISVTHCIPAITDNTTNARSIMVTSLSAFGSADTPCKFYAVEVPTVHSIMTDYLVNTLHPSLNEVSPASPYLQVDRNVVPFCVTVGIAGNNEIDKSVPRRFRRRQDAVIKQLNDQCVDAKRKRVVKKAGTHGWLAEEKVFVLPKMFSNLSSEISFTDSRTTTYNPATDLDDDAVADMPPLAPHRPAKHVLVENNDATAEHFAQVMRQHAVLGDRSSKAGVRIGQFLGLVAYHANHCQSAEPGLVLGTVVRSKLASKVARIRGFPPSSRKRCVAVNKHSELAPLARATNKKRPVDAMLFDHETSILHQ